MNIKIIGNESSNRIKLLKNLNKAIDNIRLNIKPQVLDDAKSIKDYKIFNTPALIINDKVISQGKVLNEKFGTTLTSTLSAGSTSLVFSNSVITTSSTIDLYTDAYGVNPTDVSVEAGKMTLTFDAQTKDISVKAVIK